MTKWLEQNKNIVLFIVLFLFILMSIFYFFVIRPLVVEEDNQQQQLKRINADIAFYQQATNKLKPKKFTSRETSLLIGNIPSRPYVEGIINDLVRTETETGVVIENISSVIYPNGVSEGEDPSRGKGKIQPVQNKNNGNWENILPDGTLKKLKKQMTKIDNIHVSFVELVINVNGEVASMNNFVNQLEALNRVIHVQSYEYSVNKEQGSRLEAVVTIRAFYSKDFANLIDNDNDIED